MQEEDPYLIPPDDDDSDSSDQEDGPFLVRILACQPTATTTTSTAASSNGSILSPELQQHFETMQAMWLQERNSSNDPSNSSCGESHPTIPHSATTTTTNNNNNSTNPSHTLRAQATETAMAMEQEIAQWERQVQALEEQLLASTSHHSTASNTTSHSQSAVPGGFPVSPARVDRTQEHSSKEM